MQTQFFDIRVIHTKMGDIVSKYKSS